MKDEFVQKMLTNKQYPQLTPACNEINRMIVDARDMSHDSCGAIFSAELLKDAISCRDLGYATVSITYAIFKVCVEIPKMATDAEKNLAVAALRLALKAKSFVSPDALATRMKVLAGEPLTPES